MRLLSGAWESSLRTSAPIRILVTHPSGSRFGLPCRPSLVSNRNVPCSLSLRCVEMKRLLLLSRGSAAANTDYRLALPGAMTALLVLIWPKG